MDEKELRLGNHINDGQQVTGIIGRTVYHTTIGFHRFKSLRFAQIKPIPLTEEWLLKLGFYKAINEITGRTEYNLPLKFGLLFITVDLNENQTVIVDGKSLPTDPYVSYGEYGDGYKMYNSNHVHSMQNLHFALTGEELTTEPHE